MNFDLRSRQSGVHFRKPTEPPTEDGWYYARLRYQGGKYIEPVQVIFMNGVGKAWITGSEEPDSFDTITWFGPVAEVMEG